MVETGPDAAANPAAPPDESAAPERRGARARYARIQRSRVVRLLALAIVSAGIAVLDWPVSSIAPSATQSLDGSWQMVIHQWGRQLPGTGPHVDFTYGPLGFLTIPTTWWMVTGVIAWCATAAFVTAFAAVGIVVLRRWLPWWLAVPVVLVVLRGLALYDGWVSAVPLLCLWYVVTYRPSAVRRRLAAAAALGLVAAAVLLCKFGDGIVVAAVAVAAPFVWEPQPRRELATSLGVTLGALVGGTFLGWSVLTLDPGGFAHYVSASLSLGQGYSAMATPRPAWPHAYLAAALSAVAVLALAWTLRDRPRRWVHLVLAAAVLWLEFKHAFLRADFHHLPTFFVTAALLVLAIGRVDRARWQLVRPALATAMTVVAVTSAGYLGGGLATLHPAKAFEVQVTTLASAANRAALMRNGVLAWRLRMRVPRAMLQAIGTGTVHVDPWEAVVGWAYRLHLDPVPEFQTYSAYTAALDEENAHYLAGPHAPEWILRDNKIHPVNNRFLPFESPAYQLAIVCHYRLVQESVRWELFEHAGSRCGTPVRLERVALGGTVAVPERRPGAILAATFALPKPLLDRLAAAAFRSTEPAMIINGADYEFVTGTAGDLHLLAGPEQMIGTSVGNWLPVDVLGLKTRLPGATVTFWSIPVR